MIDVEIIALICKEVLPEENKNSRYSIAIYANICQPSLIGDR